MDKEFLTKNTENAKSLEINHSKAKLQSLSRFF